MLAPATAGAWWNSSRRPVQLRFDANPGTGHVDDGCRGPRRCGNSCEKTPRTENWYSVVNEHADGVILPWPSLLDEGIALEGLATRNFD